MTGSIEDQIAAATADAERKSPPASADDPDFLIAVVMARPDITSVSDLTGKTVAIDDKYSASSSNIRVAIVAAGATEVRLSEGHATAVGRLAKGEVQAAILALVSPEAADAFPDISGFRIFRVPLSPDSLKEER